MMPPRPLRYVGGLILHELLKASHELFSAHASVVLPLAFSAKMDDDKDVAAVWKEVGVGNSRVEGGGAKEVGERLDV